MWCLFPGIQQMPAHQAHHHHPLPMYNINPALGALPPPPQLPQLHRHNALPRKGALHYPVPASREPQAELARIAAAPAAHNPTAELVRMAAALVGQEPRAEAAQGAVGAPRRAEARTKGCGTGTQSPTPWGARSCPWCWRCMGG